MSYRRTTRTCPTCEGRRTCVRSAGGMWRCTRCGDGWSQLEPTPLPHEAPWVRERQYAVRFQSGSMRGPYDTLTAALNNSQDGTGRMRLGATIITCEILRSPWAQVEQGDSDNG